MSTYANTHPETSYNAQQTGRFCEEAREIIRTAVNASKTGDKVIFTGSGATSAVHKIIHAFNHKKPLVLIGPYEHHSNILPWLNIPGAEVIRIRQNQDGLIDLGHLEKYLKKGAKREIIGSFSAASNVTGIFINVDAVSALVHKYKGVVLFDYACSGPYVKIDMNPLPDVSSAGETYKDAVFISTHKFLGGPGTPGILVAKQHKFCNKTPHNVGGGTVAFVRRKDYRFHADPEHREEGGTPAILESIRADNQLKETFTPAFILAKEKMMLDWAIKSWSDISNLIILGNMNVPRLPIFSMLVYNPESGRFLHHDFIAMVMNDVFGLQVRSGCACAAPYGLDLMGMSESAALKFQQLIVSSKNDKMKKSTDGPEQGTYSNVVFKPGFVRLNLPYFISQTTLNFVTKAVEMVAEKAWLLLPLYDFDFSTGSWWLKHNNIESTRVQLSDISINLEQLITNSVVEEPVNINSSWEDVTTNQEGASDKSIIYQEILEQAEQIFENSKLAFHETDKAYTSKTDHSSHQQSSKGKVKKDIDIRENPLRWFMLPQEAIDLLAGKSVRRLPVTDLPFFPGALAKKLGFMHLNHKARGNMDKNFPLEFN